MDKRSKTLDPITKSRLHEEIVSQVQRKVISGDFAMGEKLPAERDLAQSLRVNRATLREALKKLEMLGLVEIRHGDGIYVRNYLESGNLELFKAIVYMDSVIPLDILRNILDIRRIIVPEMAFYAARLRTDQELEDLRKAVFDGEDMPMQERDLRVHQILARCSGNMLYVFLLNFFNQLFRDYGYLYFSNADNVKRSALFHRAIYEAVSKRQPEKARKILSDVLIYVENRIYDFYESNYRQVPAKGGGL